MTKNNYKIRIGMWFFLVYCPFSTACEHGTMKNNVGSNANRVEQPAQVDQDNQVNRGGQPRRRNGISFGSTRHGDIEDVEIERFRADVTNERFIYYFGDDAHLNGDGSIVIGNGQNVLDFLGGIIAARTQIGVGTVLRLRNNINISYSIVFVPDQGLNIVIKEVHNQN